MIDANQKRKSRRISVGINAAVVLVSFALTFLLVELASWAWVSHFRSPYLSRWEFRATQPPPYRDADYFGPEFLKEAEASVSGHISTIAELKDYHGRYFNIENGFRVTTDAPANAERRVLLFGGSTLFGQEVPDRYTIASQLQRMLNEAGVAWQVRNFGLPGMNAAQQTLIFERVRLQPGDIVIYYHGVNDIYYLVFGGYESGWVGGVPAFRPVQKLSAMHKWMHAWHDRLKDYSYTAQVALDIFQRGVPDTVTDPEILRQGLATVRRQFEQAVVTAAERSRLADVRFAHFLQPTAFTRSLLTPYEVEILKNPLETAPGVATAFRQGYPLLREVGEHLFRTRNIEFHDFSGVLDNRAAGNEVYLDFCHINHEGNRLIAQHLMEDYLRPLLAR